MATPFSLPLDWRGIGILALLAAFVIAVLLLFRSPTPAHIAQCRRLYAAARTSADSTAVDQAIPQIADPKFAAERVSCGVLRQLNRL
jgi:hypothetical protein